MSDAIQNWTIIKPETAITAANTEDYKSEWLSLIDEGVDHVEINLSNVDMIDSSGLGLLIVCHQTFTAKGGHLRISNASKNIRELLKLMRLDERFEICD